VFTPSASSHYETLGLDRDCTEADIRQAFRRLSRRHHPDTNGGSAESVAHTQALNAAHAVLRDAARRRAYDEELLISEDTAGGGVASPAPAGAASGRSGRSGRLAKNLARDVMLKLEELLRGTVLTLVVNDPANPDGPESCRLTIPAGTAPKTRFKAPRSGFFAGGVVTVRVLLRPHPRFKARGSDLRCDLRITARRASSGGQEMVPGPEGGPLRLSIPARIGRGEILRLEGHGLPRARGGRGDLLVRVMYQPDVTIHRHPAAPEDAGDPSEHEGGQRAALPERGRSAPPAADD